MNVRRLRLLVTDAIENALGGDLFLPIVDIAICSCLKLPSEESAGLFSCRTLHDRTLIVTVGESNVCAAGT